VVTRPGRAPLVGDRQLPTGRSLEPLVKSWTHRRLPSRRALIAVTADLPVGSFAVFDPLVPVLPTDDITGNELVAVRG